MRLGSVSNRTSSSSNTPMRSHVKPMAPWTANEIRKTKTPARARRMRPGSVTSGVAEDHRHVDPVRGGATEGAVVVAPALLYVGGVDEEVAGGQAGADGERVEPGRRTVVAARYF